MPDYTAIDRTPRRALVNGANRGIGLAVARRLAAAGMRVAVGARDEAKALATVRALADSGADLLPVVLDVASAASIHEAVARLEREWGGVDVLVNNAGVLDDGDERGLDVSIDTVRRAFEVNTLGPLALVQALAPGMRQRGWGRVVNVSSAMGSFAEMGPRALAYRASKAALNAVTVVLALELEGSGVLVNALHPGWVRTQMGGPGATRTPDEGADTVEWLATLPADGPTGGFFRDRRPIPW